MRLTPTVIILACFAAVLVSIFSDNGYPRLTTLQSGIAAQRGRNDQLESYVASLQRTVTGLKSDDRAVEKAARNQLGMARPDELIFIFEERESTGKPK